MSVERNFQYRSMRQIAPEAQLLSTVTSSSRKTRSADVEVQWSSQTLQKLLHERLRKCEVMAVSNREPYIHNKYDESTIEVQIPASGMVAALEPVMRACGGTWVAHGSGTADRDTVDAHNCLRVPPSDPQYTLRRVWFTHEEEQGYYYGFSNEGLWPVCHVAFVRPTFRLSDWQHYVTVNKRFADAIVEEATRQDPLVLIQDYHLSLLPQMLRQRLPAATILTFWHIPWPNSEMFGVCCWRSSELTHAVLMGRNTLN